MLFDRNLVDPAKLGPQAADEGVYQYLATSNRPLCENVRIKLEEWLAQFPDEHSWEMSQRIKTSKQEFDSELFELMLHELLKRQGLEIEIHPDLPDEVEKRPDFLVRDSEGNPLYIECILATGKSDAEVSAENLVSAIFQKINEKLRTPCYFWSVNVLSQGPQAPKAGTIIYDVATWMKDLVFDDVVSEFEKSGFDTSHKFVWDNGTWRIEFVPIPKDPAKVDLPHRPIGVVQGGVQRRADDEAILAAADFKAKRYGDGARPLAIAINATHLMMDGLDFVDGLFPRGIGNPGGFWKREDGSLRNQNVEAIIAFRKCTSSNFGSPVVRVFTNPFCDLNPVIDKMPFPKTVCSPDGGTDVPGESVANLLGLPPQWPQ